ncbi:hypothetical protein [Candidatus Pelagibacter sp. HIMB1506]|uniref:hypothetical protein n=1 Tax=Candidatus Pelagibacter sp. HIMB1506 TaxID=3413337 RepID=UPI003F870A09
MTKNKTLFYILFFFVLSLFIYLFYLSTQYIINFWTFSQAHINYSDGFVKRGLFGTFAIYLENKLQIEFINTFNLFFIFFYLINIILYFLIIRKYIKYNLILIFLALSPTLIIFSFNDLGGFQRFDVISIFLILFHSYIANLFRAKKINFKEYHKRFSLIVFPISLFSIFIHEIQCWSIPFHFFLIRSIYKEASKKLNELTYFFSTLILASILVFTIPVELEIINSMIDKLDGRGLWASAITVASSSEGNINILAHELNTNLFNTYNLKINLFFLILGVLPFQILFINFKKRNLINIMKDNYTYFYLSLIPYLTFFAIGDTGRWLHIISMISFAFFAQYPIQNSNTDLSKIKTSIPKIILLIFVIIYCFFIRLPHGGNLEEKKISIWGGLYKKFEAAYKIYFVDIKEDKFMFEKRFKKNDQK